MAEEKKPAAAPAAPAAAGAAGEKKRGRRPSALKRDIQSEKRRLLNKSFRSRTLSEIRSLERAFEKKEQTLIQEHLKRLYSLMDKGVKTGIFKQNKANRFKSRFSKRALAST